MMHTCMEDLCLRISQRLSCHLRYCLFTESNCILKICIYYIPSCVWCFNFFLRYKHLLLCQSTTNTCNSYNVSTYCIYILMYMFCLLTFILFLCSMLYVCIDLPKFTRSTGRSYHWFNIILHLCICSYSIILTV